MREPNMIPHYQKGTGSYSAYHKTDLAFAELEHSIFTALETYSNVHRGSGHKSLATTALLDHARELVLEYLEFDKQEYSVIFCTPARSDALTDRLKPGSFRIISSRDIGLPVGIRALAVKKGALPGGFSLPNRRRNRPAGVSPIGCLGKSSGQV
jgi:hypothetical protein